MVKSLSQRQKEYRKRKRLLRDGNVKFETYKPPSVYILLRKYLEQKQRYFHKYDERLRNALEDLLKELSKYEG